MHQKRKADHIRINIEENVTSERISPGFERYSFAHCALPELSLDAIDTSTEFLGKNLAAPLFISPMTGGTAKARSINRHLAQAAQASNIGLGLGSQRAALEDPSLVPTYQIRDVAPDILVLANLGAVQLNYGYTTDHCQRAVDMVEADGLILHLNPLQEALQPEGQTNFAGLLPKIADVCRTLQVPIIVKEVGWGISDQVARQLADAGVAALDIAGAGGTSWSQVEMYRAQNTPQREAATAFRDWGIPTVDSLRQVRQALPHLPLAASGGIRDGIEIAKAIALGAQVCGVAGPFLAAAVESAEAVQQVIDKLVGQLRIVAFAVGARDMAALSHTPLFEHLPGTTG